MKTKKTLYLALASCSLFFASCSMNKNNMGSASLESSKMQLAQQLEGQKAMPVQSSGNSHVSSEFITPGKQSYLTGTSLNPAPIHVFPKQKNSNPVAKLVKSYFHDPILLASKAAAELQKTRNAGEHAVAHKDLPFAGANLLVMWIVFLLASILLYIIASLFAAASLPGALFTILGLIAGLIFLYFFILWLVALYKASKK